jgi:hypothetical protein
MRWNPDCGGTISNNLLSLAPQGHGVLLKNQLAFLS